MPSAFVIALGMVYLLWPNPKAESGPPLPSPNGYGDFVKGGGILAPISSDYTKMSTEELRSFVESNQEPLRLARLGLTRECRVPTENSMAYIQRHLPELSSIKGLAQLLSAEGRLAEAETRYHDAAEIHLEVIRLGQSSARGGLMIDKLVGMAIENIGMIGLERAARHLDTQSCRNIIEALEEIDVRTDLATVYLARDRQWGRKATGTGWLFAWMQSAWMAKSLFPARVQDQKFTAKLMATDRRRRHIILNFATRAYELEHSKRPSRTEDLVPSVLRAIPKDPETGTNLVLNPAL